MEEKMINAVKKWLEAIMPSVVGMYVEEHTEDVLHEMGKEEGIHGPFVLGEGQRRARAWRTIPCLHMSVRSRKT